MGFEQIYEKFKEKYPGLLSEDETMGGDPGMGAQPQMQAPPQIGGQEEIPQQPPMPPKKEFDKPYQDLAQILYKALRMNFETLPQAEKDKVLSVVPDGETSIDSDNVGSALFAAVEEVSDEQGEVVPPAEQI
jgi:hypothetical protein